MTLAGGLSSCRGHGLSMEFHKKAVPGVITALEHAKRGCILVGGVTLDATSFGGPEMNREGRAATPGAVVLSKVCSEIEIHSGSTVSPQWQIHVMRD